MQFITIKRALLLRINRKLCLYLLISFVVVQHMILSVKKRNSIKFVDQSNTTKLLIKEQKSLQLTDHFDVEFQETTKLFNDFIDLIQQIQTTESIIDLVETIDWEDTRFIEYEAKREGPGEQGKPYELTDPKEIKRNEELFKQEGFYVLVSDKISTQRALKDLRPESCKHKKYLKNLPKVSVIITFHNEVWSVLLRCIHSIYNRSPPELLHEIILVNDKSTFEELYDPLKKFVTGAFEGKIKIHDNEKREGLIRARMIGAKLAEAEVIIFLDSHMEVTNTWLPPLLEPIVYNPTYATVPIVEGMHHASLEYLCVGHGYKGIFDWNFRYQWIPFREERKDLGDNFNLSCMTGGAYAIRREHFFHLGGYDEELKIWNGENYELTLKLWLCSGGIFKVPCSRVTHLSKLHSAYRHSGDGSDFVGRNLKRVAEVWLDDYKQYFYRNEPERYSKIDAGNLTEQYERKKMLNCKPFKYYLDVIAPEMLLYYPIEPQYFAAFSIQNLESEKCLSLHQLNYDAQPILTNCSSDLLSPLKGSDFTLTLEKSIKYNDINDQCLNADTMKLSNCHHLGAAYGQYWIFNLNTRQIYQPLKNKCLSGSSINETISLNDCDKSLLNQRWRWGFENATALENWNTTGIVY